jgi:hypothetical protein
MNGHRLDRQPDDEAGPVAIPIGSVPVPSIWFEDVDDLVNPWLDVTAYPNSRRVMVTAGSPAGPRMVAVLGPMDALRVAMWLIESATLVLTKDDGGRR